jgi:REP element-mobilizing transposase RayT
MNRGRRKEKIFPADADCEAFITTLRETVALWNFRVAAYCLMSNHYHLLIQTPDGNLARGMRHLNGVYTQRFNRGHNEEGQLFRGRYKAVLVESDSHLLEVMRYIHRNPLKAGVAKTLGDYHWSSHQGYLTQGKKWAWLQKGDLLSMLTSTKAKQRSTYLDFVSKGEPREIGRFYSLKNLPSVLGSESFKEFIRDKFSALAYMQDIPESKILAPDAGKVIASVCDYYRIPRSELLVSKRGSENPPRDMAIYLVRRLCRMTLPRVGKEFGINNYSTVSSVIQRVKSKAERDKRLRKEIDKITRIANKSQKRT